MQIDLRVLELLASKICHDLVSPVSAINNGVELIEDIGGSVVEEAMQLIGASAVQASRRLRLFRMAYGRAGSEGNLSVQEVKTVAEQYLHGGKITLNWPDSQPTPVLVETRGFLKTLLNLIILGEETLAYGGVMNVRATAAGDDGCRLEIVGRNAQLLPAMQAALDGTAAIEDLSPRTIQAYISGNFAQSFNLRIGFEQSIPDRLALHLTKNPPAEATLPAVDFLRA